MRSTTNTHYTRRNAASCASPRTSRRGKHAWRGCALDVELLSPHDRDPVLLER